MSKKSVNEVLNYFSLTEKLLWTVSVILIAVSFVFFDGKNFLTLAASLVDVTSLIFNAKGNPVGQVLMIAFSIMYGIISFKFDYCGEMITYLGMTAPMAIFALVSWLKNPYKGNKSEVKVNRIKTKEIALMFVLSMLVTAVFYFVLKAFDTANLIPSTISVTTSFIAVYLTFRRSSFYAVGYAANDIVLIILWVMASTKDISYISVVICFVVFLVNDAYGFVSRNKMKQRQENND